MKSKQPPGWLHFRILHPKCWPVLSILPVLTILLLGCQQTTSTSMAPSASVTLDQNGTYHLVTLNGYKLPFKLAHQGGSPEVLSGSLTLRAEGTVSSATTFRAPNGKVVNRHVSGTYTRDGARFRMQWTGAGQTTATLETNTFTMDNEGMKFAYRK